MFIHRSELAGRNESCSQTLTNLFYIGLINHSSGILFSGTQPHPPQHPERAASAMINIMQYPTEQLRPVCAIQNKPIRSTYIQHKYFKWIHKAVELNGNKWHWPARRGKRVLTYSKARLQPNIINWTVRSGRRRQRTKNDTPTLQMMDAVAKTKVKPLKWSH